MTPPTPTLQQRLAETPAAWRRALPILDWGSRYSPATFSNDLLAAVIVTIMLIPQSPAYGLLAGLPAEVGLYASILPLVACAVFGTSQTLAVGPVSVISLMTASAIGAITPAMQVHPVVAAVLLAFMSGIMLIAMGVFRLGAIANFLSHPVISGFISASGLIIATSQLKHILGIKADGENLIQLLSALFKDIGSTNFLTLLIVSAQQRSCSGAEAG